MTPFITRACLAASVVLCFAIEPASAQYNIFNSQSGLVTDVIVNGIRMPLTTWSSLNSAATSVLALADGGGTTTAISAARAGQRYTTSIPVKISRKGGTRRHRLKGAVRSSPAARFAAVQVGAR